MQGGSTDTKSSKSESHESGEGGLFVGVKTTAEVGLITSDSHSESLDTTTTSMFNDVGVKTTAEVGLQRPCSMVVDGTRVAVVQRACAYPVQSSPVQSRVQVLQLSICVPIMLVLVLE